MLVIPSFSVGSETFSIKKSAAHSSPIYLSQFKKKTIYGIDRETRINASPQKKKKKTNLICEHILALIMFLFHFH